MRKGQPHQPICLSPSIFYVCLCLLVRPPLRLSRSKLTVRIKRTWFHWQQIPFVFYFTLAAYFIPIIWRLLNLEELFRLLKNASVDLCFVQPSFIADISKSVFRACNDIEELRELFSTEIETIKRLSQDASAYFLCTSASASIEVLLNNLAKEANATAGAVFAASACGSLRFDALVVSAQRSTRFVDIYHSQSRGSIQVRRYLMKTRL